MQRQAGARFLAHGDVAQHRVLVQFGLLDQAQLVEGGGLRARLRGAAGVRDAPAEGGEAGFQPDHEARHQVRPVQAQGAQGLQVGGFDARVAGVIGEPEQLLLEFRQHRGEVALELVRGGVEQVLEYAPHASRQGGGGQRLRCGSFDGGWRCGHRDARLWPAPVPAM